METEKILGKFNCWPTDLVAVVILAAGAFRVFGDPGLSGRADNTTLLYLGTAAGVFLLRRVKNVKYDKVVLELKELREEANEAKLLAGIAVDNPIVNAPFPDTTKSFLTRDYETEIKPGPVDNDPWKGVFGGKSIDKETGRALEAEVTPLRDSPGWFSLVLKVVTLPGRSQLEGNVVFFLHDTFTNQKPIVKATNGTAILRLKVWGAFTVGALADDGKTKLELDLADLKTAPNEFRLR